MHIHDTCFTIFLSLDFRFFLMFPSLFNVTSPFSFLDESYLNVTKYMYTVTKELKVGHNNDINVGKWYCCLI